MTFELVRDKPDGWGTSVAIAATVALVAVGLFFAFAIGVSAIPRRGWRRIPMVSSLILGGLAALSLLIVSLASVEASSPATNSDDVTFIAVRAGAAMACSLALIVFISRRPASDWLAKRRHAALPPSIED